jgi:hypothetical protein
MNFRQWKGHELKIISDLGFILQRKMGREPVSPATLKNFAHIFRNEETQGSYACREYDILISTKLGRLLFE